MGVFILPLCDSKSHTTPTQLRSSSGTCPTVVGLSPGLVRTHAGGLPEVGALRHCFIVDYIFLNDYIIEYQ